MSEELYKVHRPQELSDMVGQEAARNALETMLDKGKLPHAILLRGPSGCGKTTIARILKVRLLCSDMDFYEINAAQSRGIDTVREIQKNLYLSPVKGKSRIYLIDEAHGLTNDAQQSLLKVLEDTPRHVYFVLASTNPTKLISTIRNRCTDIELTSVTIKDLTKLIKRVCKREKITLSEEVRDALAEGVGGSPRRCMVLLDQIRHLDSDEEQLQVIKTADEKKVSETIAQMLVKGRDWKEIAVAIKTCEQEPESIRRGILGYFEAILLNGGGKFAARAADIMECFRDNYYDCGRAGLTLSCWEATHTK